MEGRSRIQGGLSHLGSLLSLSSLRTRRAGRTLQVEAGRKVLMRTQRPSWGVGGE